MVGSRCFLFEPTKKFFLKMKRKLKERITHHFWTKMPIGNCTWACPCYFSSSSSSFFFFFPLVRGLFFFSFYWADFVHVQIFFFFSFFFCLLLCFFFFCFCFCLDVIFFSRHDFYFLINLGDLFFIGCLCLFILIGHNFLTKVYV